MSRKMIRCTACGASIAKSANVCPMCGAKNKKHTGLAVVLIVLGICIIIAAFGGSGDEPKKVGASAPDASPSVTQTQSIFDVGDSVELDDVVVTLVGVSENRGEGYLAPSSGKVFIVCEFEIENNSTDDIAVSSMLSFDAYIDDYSTNMNLSAMLSTDKSQLDGTVAAGKKMNGVIGYEASPDWSEIEIKFTPSFWSAKDITFVATR